MEKVLQDARRKPNIFFWFGAIPADELKEWTEHMGIRLPADLLDFWRVTGGADMFESETVLRPDVPSRPNTGFIEGDDTATANAWHRAKSLSENFFVFQTGSFLSVIDLQTLEYVSLSAEYAPEARFASFEEWYAKTVRAEFAERYGLDR
jgi:hypothetical protein